MADAARHRCQKTPPPLWHAERHREQSRKLPNIPDPRGREGNSGDGSIWALDVTLPDTLCESCTLQLIQVMDGETEEPVDDPVGRATYYQCADIRIVEDLPDPPDELGCSAAPSSSHARPGIAALSLLGLVGWRRHRARRG